MSVATLGTALTRHHADRLGRFCDTVILLFDGDLAGQRAADRAVEIFFSSTVDVTTLHACPMDSIRTNFSEEMGVRPSSRRRSPPPSMRLSHSSRTFGRHWMSAGGVSARQRIVDDVINRLNGLGLEGVAGVRRSFIIDQIAGILGVTALDVGSGDLEDSLQESSETADHRGLPKNSRS